MNRTKGYQLSSAVLRARRDLGSAMLARHRPRAAAALRSLLRLLDTPRTPPGRLARAAWNTSRMVELLWEAAVRAATR